MAKMSAFRVCDYLCIYVLQEKPVKASWSEVVTEREILSMLNMSVVWIGASNRDKRGIVGRNFHLKWYGLALDSPTSEMRKLCIDVVWIVWWKVDHGASYSLTSSFLSTTERYYLWIVEHVVLRKGGTLLLNWPRFVMHRTNEGNSCRTPVR